MLVFQIKGNEMYGNMQANIFLLHTPLTPGRGLTVKTFIYWEWPWGGGGGGGLLSGEGRFL